MLKVVGLQIPDPLLQVTATPEYLVSSHHHHLPSSGLALSLPDWPEEALALEVSNKPHGIDKLGNSDR
jgi:hypothetical protein